MFVFGSTPTHIQTTQTCICEDQAYDIGNYGNHGNHVREHGERLGQGLGFGEQGLCGGARRAVSFLSSQTLRFSCPSVRLLRASHHGEVLEA